jgi:ATP-dependent RNA helicase DDX23/PRP28
MSSSYDRSRSPVRRSNNDYRQSDGRGGYDRRDNNRRYDDYNRSSNNRRDHRNDRDYDNSRRRKDDYDRYDRSDRSSRQEDRYNKSDRQQPIPDEDIKMESTTSSQPSKEVTPKKRVPISIEELIQKKELEKQETAKVSSFYKRIVSQ